MKPATYFLMVLTVSLAPGLARGQDAGWPRVVKDGKTQIVVYQPQPDSLDGVTLQSRVAVSIKRPEDKTPLFGALWVTAILDVDRDRDLARVVSARIDRTRFTGVADGEVQSLVQLLESDVTFWDLSISLTRLRASLQPAQGGPDADYRNDPPNIIVVDKPAILLLLDGEPRLQDVGSGGLQKVVNTALPVLFDPKSKQYWFYGSTVWFTTNDLLRGTWRPADKAPANIADLVKDPDTLEVAQDDAGKAATPAQLRAARIIVATEPTELIVTQGAPEYKPLVGGEILYVTNTDSDIFLETATQRHFIIISGRWFAGPSVQGPWTFVAPESLPKAFANIPEYSPKANDLAFVPGTDQAKDAVMDSVIPQTAEISRSEAQIEVQYDGAPQFSPIPSTSLAYAQNTPSQVIRAGDTYYACDEGVWYAAPSANGPWSVSDIRPPGVDDIPASSPVYNTKYVYIYDSTPDVVYVGYLPGYRWSLPYHGVIYYGTGWRYRGWYGRYYFPRPATWGFFVHYNPWTGWNFGMSWTAGWLGLTSHWGAAWAGWQPVYVPGYHVGFWSGYYAGGWFGPGGYRPPRPHAWRPPVRPGRATILPYPYPSGGRGGRPGNNLYNRPDRPGVRPRPNRPATGSSPGKPATGRGPGRPAPGSDPGKPATGRGPGRPAPGSDPGKPATGRGPGRPAPGSDPGKPATGRGPGRPAPGSDPGKPATGGDPGKPATGGGPGRPAPEGDPGKPATGGDPGKPATETGPGRPTPGSDPGKPATGGDPDRPQPRPGRGGDDTKPGKGRGDSRPSTRPDPVTTPRPRLPNNVYTDRDGNVHRNNGGNWQTRQDRTWKPEAAPAPAPAPMHSRPAPAAPRPTQPPAAPPAQAPAAPPQRPERPAPPQRPQVRPAIPTEPRGGGSVEGERDARNRGSAMAPPDGARTGGRRK